MPTKKEFDLVAKERYAYKTENDALKDKLKQSESMKEYYSNAHDVAKSEVEALHAVLDVLPCVISRKKSDGYSEHSAMVRFAAWLAKDK